MDKSVVSRAFKTMERDGIVQRDPDTHGYRLGWRLPMLLVSTEISTVMQVANKTIVDLAAKFPGTVLSLVILRNNRAFLPYNVSAGGGIYRDQPWSATGHPAFSVAAGRALLIDCSLADLHQIYPNGLDLKEAPLSRVRTTSDLAKLLQVARREGFAYSDSEYIPDWANVAAPIRDHSGKIVAAINISGLQLPAAQPARERKLHEIGREIARAVSITSNELGWIPFSVG
jgi:IclR family transcriptional regulator, KDG regulon repressor